MEDFKGRLIDIPYKDAPPLLFIYQQAAQLSLGTYTWAAGTKNPFTPSRPILPNVLYYFQTLDFACDIDPVDFQANVASWPLFSMYLQSTASAPALREPVALPKYYDNLTYKLFILGSELLGQAYPGSNPVTSTQGYNYNRLLGGISGTVTQTTPLLGKQILNAIITLTAQEIVDKEFIDLFQKKKSARNARSAF